MEEKNSLLTLLVETFASQSFMFEERQPKKLEDPRYQEYLAERRKLQHLKANSKLYSCLSDPNAEGNKEGKRWTHLAF